jgi:formate-dependent nitrite reductase cytochrome c552 subunit
MAAPLSFPALGAAALALLLSAPPASAQQSLCADCHFANAGGPNPMHLHEWDLSAHGRAGVGCEACHGGNPKTVESFLAHQTIVRGRGLDNPVNRRNLPATCGKCHSGPYTEFQGSKHFLLLRNGDPAAPSCSTCHGDVAAYLLSPKGLESECNGCHGRGKKQERPEYASNARFLLQSTRDTRALLDSAKSLIKHVADAKLRASLQYDYDQALVPLLEAAHAGHAFVFDKMEERLGVAMRRAEALTDRLANLGGR